MGILWLLEDWGRDTAKKLWENRMAYLQSHYELLRDLGCIYTCSIVCIKKFRFLDLIIRSRFFHCFIITLWKLLLYNAAFVAADSPPLPIENTKYGCEKDTEVIWRIGFIEFMRMFSGNRQIWSLELVSTAWCWVW